MTLINTYIIKMCLFSRLTYVNKISATSGNNKEVHTPISPLPTSICFFGQL